eukprot:Clim_evm10s37 gene=Clim_evmTU10s37
MRDGDGQTWCGCPLLYTIGIDVGTSAVKIVLVAARSMEIKPLTIDQRPVDNHSKTIRVQAAAGSCHCECHIKVGAGLCGVGDIVAYQSYAVAPPTSTRKGESVQDPKSWTLGWTDVNGIFRYDRWIYAERTERWNKHCDELADFYSRHGLLRSESRVGQPYDLLKDRLSAVKFNSDDCVIDLQPTHMCDWCPQRVVYGLAGVSLSGQMHSAVLLRPDESHHQTDSKLPIRWKADPYCMLWNDSQAHHHAAAMNETPELLRALANLIMPGFTAPKLRYLCEDLNKREFTTCVMPKDWVRCRLLEAQGFLAEPSEGATRSLYSPIKGWDPVTDYSDASGTMHLRLAGTGAHSPERGGRGNWLHQFRQDCFRLPDCFSWPALSESTEPDTGNCVLAVVDNDNDSPGYCIRVYMGAADNAAAAVGMGVVANALQRRQSKGRNQENDMGDRGTSRWLMSLGTSGTTVIPPACESVYPDAAEAGVHTFYGALPYEHYFMAVHLSAASAMSWWTSICRGPTSASTENLHVTESSLIAELFTDTGMADSISSREENANAYDDALHCVAYGPTDANRNGYELFFIPYLSGERTPFDITAGHGTFLGLSPTTTRMDMTRAVLQGVAFAFRLGVTAVTDSVGGKCSCPRTASKHVADEDNTEVLLVGGGARSWIWRAIFAAVMQKPMVAPVGHNTAAAVGAARLAVLGVKRERRRLLRSGTDSHATADQLCPYGPEEAIDIAQDCWTPKQTEAPTMVVPERYAADWNAKYNRWCKTVHVMHQAGLFRHTNGEE